MDRETHSAFNDTQAFQGILLKQTRTFKCERLTEEQTDDRQVTPTHQPAYTGDSTTCQIIGPP